MPKSKITRLRTIVPIYEANSISPVFSMIGRVAVSLHKDILISMSFSFLSLIPYSIMGSHDQNHQMLS